MIEREDYGIQQFWIDEFLKRVDGFDTIDRLITTMEKVAHNKIRSYERRLNKRLSDTPELQRDILKNELVRIDTEQQKLLATDGFIAELNYEEDEYFSTREGLEEVFNRLVFCFWGMYTDNGREYLSAKRQYEIPQSEFVEEGKQVAKASIDYVLNRRLVVSVREIVQSKIHPEKMEQTICHKYHISEEYDLLIDEKQEQLKRWGFDWSQSTLSIDGIGYAVFFPMSMVLMQSQVPYRSIRLRSERTSKPLKGEFNGWDFASIYVNAYERGLKYFDDEFRPKAKDFHGAVAEELAAKIWRHYTEIGYKEWDGIKGWMQVKQLHCWKDPFDRELVDYCGYYAGIVIACEHFMHDNKSYFPLYEHTNATVGTLPHTTAKVKSHSKEVEIDFEELFYDKEKVGPCVQVLRELVIKESIGKRTKDYSVLGEGLYYNGNSKKYIFGLWYNELVKADPPIIQQVNNRELLARLMCSYFEGLSVTGKTLKTITTSKLANEVV